MAKFDFNNSRYAKFFQSQANVNYLQTILNREDMLFVNYNWWLSQCNKDAMPVPTDRAGIASFTQKCRKLQAAHLMDLRAPLGKGLQEDAEGIDFYTATIPHFISTATVETAPERMNRIKLFEELGNDADIIAEWLRGVQDKLDQADQTVNWMVAQLMTKGYINYQSIGRGIQAPLHKANIPAANFQKAGAKVWTATDAKILTTMAEKEQAFRDATGYEGPLVWQMTRTFFQNVFCKNQEVMDIVKSWRYVNKIADLGTIPVSVSDWNKAYADITTNMAPIELVAEKERNLTDAGSSIVQGWDNKYVVLRQAGKPCDLKWAVPMDQVAFANGMLAPEITKVFARAKDGLCTVINTTSPNGEYSEWRTEVAMSATPALNNFMNHIIVDTSVAG